MRPHNVNPFSHVLHPHSVLPCSGRPRAIRPNVLTPKRTAAIADPLSLGERGAVTAEYAIATIAAVGFAALLVVVLRSDEVRGLLMSLIRHALALPA